MAVPANGNLKLPSVCLIPFYVGPVCSASDVGWRRVSISIGLLAEKDLLRAPEIRPEPAPAVVAAPGVLPAVSEFMLKPSTAIAANCKVAMRCLVTGSYSVCCGYQVLCSSIMLACKLSTLNFETYLATVAVCLRFCKLR